MSSIFDLLSQQLAGDGLSRIQQQLGTDEATTAKAVPAALGTLMGALAKNSAGGGGADALLGALSRDHDGSILDNLAGHLTSPDENVGSGILRHVLGSKQSTVEAGLGQSVGLDAGSSAKLLAMLAPVVMGALGRTQRQSNLDAGGLASILGQERQELSNKVPGGLGMLGSLLDQDGDGKIVDDVAKLGGGLLKNLLGRR
ncbi:MAG: DUF937 domain-containing protein [Acidobacteriota bacterium]|nr:DUF937 domain-containing protein [Acidobacteriota bacterium]